MQPDTLTYKLMVIHGNMVATVSRYGDNLRVTFVPLNDGDDAALRLDATDIPPLLRWLEELHAECKRLAHAATLSPAHT